MHNRQEEIMRPQEAPKKGVQELYMLLHDLVYILAVVTVLFTLLVRLVTVSGPSMTSTLLDTDYIAVLSNVFYRDINEGDIVVARVPEFEAEPIVKRVIATQGQCVDIQYDAVTGVGTVFVDGQALDEPYINEPMYAPSYPTVSFPLTVPEGCVFVMGDNRNHSADSRYTSCGVFSTQYILGKVLLVVWPGRENAAQDRDFSRIGAVS